MSETKSIPSTITVKRTPRRDIEAPRGRMKATPLVASTSTPSESLALFEALRETLGESRFVSILQSIDKAVRSMSKTTHRGSDDVANMRLRNIARVEFTRASLMRDSMGSDEVGRMLGRSRPTILKLAKAGSLLALQDGRFLRFPPWQFDTRSHDGMLPGLRQVLSVMDASPLRKAVWLLSANVNLAGKTPIDLLRRGDTDRVREEASAVMSS